MTRRTKVRKEGLQICTLSQGQGTTKIKQFLVREEVKAKKDRQKNDKTKEHALHHEQQQKCERSDVASS